MGVQPEDVFASEGDEYVPTLSAELQETALNELREDEATRSHAIAQLRSWLVKHPDIKNCRTDSVFLLRFLRTKKFSVTLAQEMIEKYLTVRQLYPHWFQKLDADDPTINKILDDGYIYPLPKRDEFGRRVLMTCAGRFDPYKYTACDLVRTHSLVSEFLMDEEESQVVGFTYVNDESNMLMGHVSMWSLNEIRQLSRCIQNSTPMRHKTTHFINIPNFANKIFEFFISLLSSKLQSRIKLHKNLDELKEHVNEKILPKEYGGEVPMAEMIAKFKEELHAKRDLILSLDKMIIAVNKKGKFVTDMEADMGSVSGSFRKLEVD